MMTVVKMKIVIDTREQTPLDFERYGCEVVRGGLTTGDYAVAGLESLAAVERKSEDDLPGCLTRERDRFERELCVHAAWSCSPWSVKPHGRGWPAVNIGRR